MIGWISGWCSPLDSVARYWTHFHREALGLGWQFCHTSIWTSRSSFLRNPGALLFDTHAMGSPRMFSRSSLKAVSAPSAVSKALSLKAHLHDGSLRLRSTFPAVDKQRKVLTCFPAVDFPAVDQHCRVLQLNVSCS